MPRLSTTKTIIGNFEITRAHRNCWYIRENGEVVTWRKTLRSAEAYCIDCQANDQTAKAMNESGAFGPFIVIGGRPE